MDSVIPHRRSTVPVLSKESIIILITAFIVMSQIAGGMYTPQKNHPDPDSHDSGEEDDDMDQIASTIKKNRGQGKSETPDHLEENEPDGAYEESPRDEEGQADVEKFFDDHLGASERDGMDKENLPSNLAELIIQLPLSIVRSNPEDMSRNKNADLHASSSEIDLRSEDTPLSLDQQQPDTYFPKLNTQQQFTMLPAKKNEREPNNPIQRMDDNSDECYECDEPRRIKTHKRKEQPKVGKRNRKTGSGRIPQEETRAYGKNVVAIENDDDDRIYVTNKTNQPFRIDALGGYDPEEDFKSASKDIEDPGTPLELQNLQRKSKDKPDNTPQDVIFNDTENDGPVEDASVTDEVTFESDNPYKKEEMEDEIKSLPSSKRSDKLNKGNTQERNKSPYDNDGEDTVKDWVNDGVEDMEIPSQTDQDIVLEKAARMEELAQERRDKEKQEQTQKDNEDQQPDEFSQRMPNADYMKNDLDDEFDDS